jgi:hypothetical protein
MHAWVWDEARNEQGLDDATGAVIKVIGCMIEIEERQGSIHIEILGAERVDHQESPRIVILDVKPTDLGPSAKDLKRSMT